MQKISNFKDKILLYVEDEDETREILSTILKKLVSKIYVASNGLEGLEIFNSKKDEINLIITDLHLPFLNGQDLIEEIKKSKDELPILITTSFINDIPKDCKACSILKKPISKDSLFDAVEKCLVK